MDLRVMANCWVCWDSRGRGCKVVLGRPYVGAVAMVLRVKACVEE